MLEILDKFKKVKLNISIDGTGTTYDYMRFPSGISLIVE